MGAEGFKAAFACVGEYLDFQEEFLVLLWLWFGAFAQSVAGCGGKPWTKGRDVTEKHKAFTPFHIHSLSPKKIK